MATETKTLRSIVGYLREVEHWPVKAEHNALLQDAETQIAKAEGSR